jgi:hypothetical protein
MPSLDLITDAAANSAIARYNWRNRGRAPIGYIKGMAVAYARVFCRYQGGNPAARAMAAADTDAPDTDALSWYRDEFTAIALSNASEGTDTLRHLFVLLTGLGMRESSGRYCEGRDRSANNTAADTAEAGLFQVSYNACRTPRLRALFEAYKDRTDFLSTFREGVTPKPGDLENYGAGSGADFQALNKNCPAFAVEFAALALRSARGHWGPIGHKAAELRVECDALFSQVERLVAQNDLCQLVR